MVVEKRVYVHCMPRGAMLLCPPVLHHDQAPHESGALHSPQPFWCVMRPRNTISLCSAPTCRRRRSRHAVEQQQYRCVTMRTHNCLHCNAACPLASKRSAPPLQHVQSAPHAQRPQKPNTHLQPLGGLVRQLGLQLAGKKGVQLSRSVQRQPGEALAAETVSLAWQNEGICGWPVP